MVLLAGYFVGMFVVLLTGSVEASADYMLVGIVAVPLLMWGVIAAAAAADTRDALRRRRWQRLMFMRRLRDTDLREMYRDNNERGS